MSVPPDDGTWPVATSPATGHPEDTEWFCYFDIDELLEAMSRPLVDPPPIRDKALEEA